MNIKERLSYQNMKNTIWTSVAFTIVGILNLILFITLSSLDIVSVRNMAYVFAVGFIFIAWVPLVLEIIFNIKFHLTFLIVFEIYMFLGICVGSLWEIYTAGFGFDKMVHVLGGLMLALLAYEIFSQCKGNRLSGFWLFMLIFSISMMLGGVWEIYEFVTDGWFGNNAQHAAEFVGREAVYDTMFDLICDFAGGIVGAAVAVIMESRKAKSQQIEDVEEKQKTEVEKTASSKQNKASTTENGQSVSKSFKSTSLKK